MKVASSGDILSSLQTNSQVYISHNDQLRPFKIQSIRKEKNIHILSIEGFRKIEESEKLIGKIIYFPKKDTETLLEPGEFFTHQLLGFIPYTGEVIYSNFKLQEVLENPVHPILLFTDGTTEVLIPFINQFVGLVNLESQRIEILNWEDWLFAD